ncbi:MAG: DegV family protein [Clostridia bacterium]|nr:DegV family protein [Clostridia bacterium]
MSVRIFIDSTCDLPAELRATLPTVALTVRFGDVEYRDGVDITHREFYTKLTESSDLPTTSQASPNDFLEALKTHLSPDDQAIIITVSGKLSGTCQSAVIASQDYAGRVFVVDSKNVAIGTGILVQYALQLVQSGMSAPEIVSALENQRERVRVIALLDTLEYVKRGGRISKTAAFAGALLNIKPVACIEDGEIKILGKARGSKMGNNLLAEHIEKSGGVDFSMPLLLGYTGVSDELLRQYIEDSAHLWRDSTPSLPQTPIGSVIGTHAGPGAVAVAFFCGK